MNSKPTTYNPADDGIFAGKAEAHARANHEAIATLLKSCGFETTVTLEGVTAKLNRSVLINEVWLPICDIDGYETPRLLLRKSDNEILVR